jgi:hypothetical protein
MKKLYVGFAILFCIHINSFSQSIKGTIHGKVVDINSESPMPFANIAIIDSIINLGTISDEYGKFRIDNVPVGRYQIQVSFVGYESLVLSDVLVSSINNQQLTIRLTESAYSLNEVTVRPKQVKEKPLNKMATVSAKQLNMEEANRFAGGLDDPARLVTSFAGVATGTGDNNSFSVRGNSPKGLLWRIEGIPVPNPNHFADVTGFGGGGITALSSQTIGNSDFFIGAFPAEYGNALSSVFDLTIRNGNNSEYHHAFQVGVWGLDVASEGPFSKNSNSSYLFNYRYSTLGLLGLDLKYQDFSYKLNFPTKKAGTFSLWGLGLIDAMGSEPDTEDKENWKYYDDISTEEVELTTGIGGLTHRIRVGKKGFLKSTATISYNHTISENSQLDTTFSNNYPLDKINYTALDYRFSSTLNYKFGAKHTNQIGFLITNLNYDFDMNNAAEYGNSLTTFANDKGKSNLIEAFTQSSFSLGRLQINPGVHLLYFALNDELSLEPRLGMDYAVNDRNTISFGYGLHSQAEKLSYYLADITVGGTTSQLNKNLGLTKSHHIVLAYDHMFGENTHLRIEPYYQYLFNVPVVDGTYFSMLNLNDEFFINEKLVNEGTGENMGIDLTFERFMNNGYYYLLTTSVFDSKYIDGSGIERSTRFNRQLIGNFLIGKEWKIKDKNMFTANIRYTYLGGECTHPVDETASLIAKEAIDDYSKAYTIQNPTSHIVSFTATYRVNKKKYSSLWSLQILNLAGAKEYYGSHYNFKDHTIDPFTDVIILPNISYKIEF